MFSILGAHFTARRNRKQEEPNGSEDSSKNSNHQHANSSFYGQPKGFEYLTFPLS